MAENNPSELENELVSFREDWKNEIGKGSDGKRMRYPSHGEEDVELTTEERAAQLFLEGTRYEKDGQFNVAVYYYRQAVHLVPDIEFKIAQSSALRTKFEMDESEDDLEGDGYSSQESLAGTSTLPVEEDLSNALGSMSLGALCSPETPQMATHISALPTELLSLLFRWVVSKELDVCSLSRLSRVCKWFYVCARDEELWKQMCLRMWGINANVELYTSWKYMFMDRPRIKLNGIYISTNSYIHIGEPTVGSYYNPCHVVQYYKYLRFFSDGTVLIYTSAEEPLSAVQVLNQPPFRDPSIYKGYFRLTEGNKVNIFYMRVLKPKKEFNRRRNRDKPEVREHHFFMTLVLKGTSRRRNYQLLWDMYMYQIKNRKSGESSENDIDFNSFKPFVFSPVRSYLAQSASAL